MEKVILISGKKQHGKDTVGKLIKLIIAEYELKCLYERENPLLDELMGTLEQDLIEINRIIDLDCRIYKDRELDHINPPSYIFGERATLIKIDSFLEGVGVGYVFQTAFSHSLKRIVSILTGCKLFLLELDSFKNTFSSIKKTHHSFYTYRELLQYIGTELFRDQLDPLTWVNCYLNNRPIQQNPVHENCTIITDWRFSNEKIRLSQELDIELITIRVINPHIFTNSTNEHESERALDKENFDFNISNFSDLRELYRQVKLLLINQKIIA